MNGKLNNVYHAKRLISIFISVFMSTTPFFPLLLTKNFLLRKIEASDITQIFRGLSNPKITQWYGVSYEDLESTRAQMTWYRDIIEAQSGIWWAICTQQDPTSLLGTCGFYEHDKDNRNTDMGYWLHEECWGQRIMYECLPAILEYAFIHMNIHRVEAEVEPENLASSKLLRKLGFSLEGRRRECGWKTDRFVDLEYYSLLSHELSKL
jgi:ribosomal-protein-alanine N-acetyltransferase